MTNLTKQYLTAVPLDLINIKLPTGALTWGGGYLD